MAETIAGQLDDKLSADPRLEKFAREAAALGFERLGQNTAKDAELFRCQLRGKCYVHVRVLNGRAELNEFVAIQHRLRVQFANGVGEWFDKPGVTRSASGALSWAQQRERAWLAANGG